MTNCAALTTLSVKIWHASTRQTYLPDVGFHFVPLAFDTPPRKHPQTEPSTLSNNTPDDYLSLSIPADIACTVHFATLALREGLGWDSQKIDFFFSLRKACLFIRRRTAKFGGLIANEYGECQRPIFSRILSHVIQCNLESV